MGTRPCDVCGGRASRFTKYAMCGSCLDRAVELYVLRAKEFDSALNGKAKLAFPHASNALQQEE